MCTVVNKYKSDFDVLIMRGSRWGNPFVLEDTKDDAARAECIKKFKQKFIADIRAGIITKDDLLSLYGKRLGCCCHPKTCHGDVIAEVVNKVAAKYGFDIPPWD